MAFSLHHFSVILIIGVVVLWPVSGENQGLLRTMFGFRGISDNIDNENPKTYIRLPLTRGNKKLSNEEDDEEEEGTRPYLPEENWSNAAYENPNVYGQRWGIQYGSHQKPVVIVVPDKHI